MPFSIFSVLLCGGCLTLWCNVRRGEKKNRLGLDRSGEISSTDDDRRGNQRTKKRSRKMCYGGRATDAHDKGGGGWFHLGIGLYWNVNDWFKCVCLLGIIDFEPSANGFGKTMIATNMPMLKVDGFKISVPGFTRTEVRIGSSCDPGLLTAIMHTHTHTHQRRRFKTSPRA